MSNALAAETSPYLLQHAENPVDWQPWGEPALARAREGDTPILLSIGYSACHWCHVMERESFEDAAIAAQMNALFVCIKVDREERPDLDKIYQSAHQMLTRRPGGWPLTLALTPHGHAPFFAGTYFPPQPRMGMPGFGQVLEQVAAHYRQHGDQMGEHARVFAAAMTQLNPTEQAAAPPTAEAALAAAVRELAGQFDGEFGGFGNAPKFPHPTQLDLLLRGSLVGGGGSDGGGGGGGGGDGGGSDATNPIATQSARMLDLTLHKMAEGGLFDQLGGGFYRYSVDRQWRIPHFEKMLYDNAQLLALYSDAWRHRRVPLYRTIAERTAGWVIAEMQQPHHGYASTLDADSEGSEGKYYVWSETDLRAILTAAEYAALEEFYGLVGEPNFEGNWHFNINPEAQRGVGDVAGGGGVGGDISGGGGSGDDIPDGSGISGSNMAADGGGSDGVGGGGSGDNIPDGSGISGGNMAAGGGGSDGAGSDGNGDGVGGGRAGGDILGGGMAGGDIPDGSGISSGNMAAGGGGSDGVGSDGNGSGVTGGGGATSGGESTNDLSNRGDTVASGDAASNTPLTTAHTKLLTARHHRIPPALDDKILTAWNGMMIKGMARAAHALGRDDFAQSATAALGFIRATLWQNRRLLVTSRGGTTRLNAYLDDYAFLAEGILDLLQTRWRSADLAFATDLADAMLEHFEDPTAGGFYFTSHDHEPLLHRPKTGPDDAIPSGNGAAARVLFHLGHLLGNPRYLEAAEKTLRLFAPALTRSPSYHGSLTAALQARTAQTIILRAHPADAPQWQAAYQPHLHHHPETLTLTIPPQTQALPPTLAQRKAHNTPVAYVCQATHCSAPVDTPEALAALLSSTTAV